jgi:hypothetical protein
MAPVRTIVPEPVAPVFILIPLAYIFLMLRRIFGQKAWLTALKTVGGVPPVRHHRGPDCICDCLGRHLGHRALGVGR